MAKALRAGALDAARAAAEGMAAESQPICPIAPHGEPSRGRLRSSMTVRDKGRTAVEVRYGAPYAAEVHENSYDYGTPGTGPHYLRIPMMRFRRRLAEMAAALRAALERA